MDIMELGAIGELVGGVAVLVTLIYLAVQVRHTTKAIDQSSRIAAGTTFHEVNSAYTDVYGLIAQDPDLAEIYRKGLLGEELNATEIVRYEALLQFHFAWLEDVHNQQTLQLLSEMSPTEHLALEAFAPFFQRLLTGQYARDWWLRDAPYQYTHDFYEEASRVLLHEGEA